MHRAVLQPMVVQIAVNDKDLSAVHVIAAPTLVTNIVVTSASAAVRASNAASLSWDTTLRAVLLVPCAMCRQMAVRFVAASTTANLQWMLSSHW